MADFGQLLEELPNIADSLKLSIGDANKIRCEATRLNKIGLKLQDIHQAIDKELGFEKFKNTAMRALPFLGTAASFFIPGGFIVDAVIAGGAGFISDKFGDPEAEVTLEDLKFRVEDWIDWSNNLQEFAQDFLSNKQLLAHINTEQLKPSVIEQIKNIESCLKNNLDFSNYNLLKKELEKIKNAQHQLTELQKRLNQITDIIENSESITDLLFAITSFFGNCDFALDWFHEEYGLIISSYDNFISLGDIFNECESLREKSANLILQANTLKGQVEQNLKYIEQENRKEKANSLNSASDATSQVKNNTEVQTQLKERESSQITKQKSFVVILISIFSILGFGAWIGREKILPVQPISAASNQEIEIANFKNAQEIAMEAALIVQNNPNSLDTWEQAETKWQKVLKLLENIPEGTSVYYDAKNKLATYRLNYETLKKKLVKEREANLNWENAQKIALEAAIIVQNPPHAKEVWQQAKDKWEQSIKLLEAIPKDTFLYQQAQEKLITYRTNYTAISIRIK